MAEVQYTMSDAHSYIVHVWESASYESKTVIKS